MICKNCGNKQSSKWQFCHKCKVNLYPTSSIGIFFKPSWNVKVDPNYMDAKSETRATEAMLAERNKEIRMSKRSRNWEQGRKKAIMNYKPQWVKRGRKASDLPKI